MNDLLEAALRYAEGGKAVLPMQRDKAPHGRLVPRGVYDATTDAAQIAAWWRRAPQANVGVACGGGLAVLDCDPRDGGPATLRRLLAEAGAELPDAPEVHTGGGGFHRYYAAPPGLRCARLGPGLDLKAQGGLVVAPPSLHESGRLYAWHPMRDLAAWPSLPPLPTWASREAAVAPPGRAADARDEDDPLRAIPAPEFVADLLGRHPDRKGFVTCPFPWHKDGQERKASLALYGPGTPRADGDPGWYCFGCCVGGSIYTMAALVGGYALPLRGAAFLTVQATLLKHFSTTRAAA